MANKFTSQSIGVHGFIFDASNNILLLKRSGDDQNEPGYWDLPGGGILISDSIENGFKREVLEETFLRIDKIRIIGVYTIEDFSLQFFVFARLKSGIPRLNGEHSEYCWKKIEDIEKLTSVGIHIKAAKYFLKNKQKLVSYEQIKNY